MKNYEILEHTADIFIKAYGTTLSEAFENAAVAMFDIIFPTNTVKPIGEYQLELKADDLEQLLVVWLSELLYIYETQRVLFSNFKVQLDENQVKITSQAYGEIIDPAKHKITDEIKAVTYHMLEIGQDEETGNYFIKVLFDI